MKYSISENNFREEAWKKERVWMRQDSHCIKFIRRRTNKVNGNKWKVERWKSSKKYLAPFSFLLFAFADTSERIDETPPKKRWIFLHNRNKLSPFNRLPYPVCREVFSELQGTRKLVPFIDSIIVPLKHEVLDSEVNKPEKMSRKFLKAWGSFPCFKFKEKFNKIFM